MFLLHMWNISRTNMERDRFSQLWDVRASHNCETCVLHIYIYIYICVCVYIYIYIYVYIYYVSHNCQTCVLHIWKEIVSLTYMQRDCCSCEICVLHIWIRDNFYCERCVLHKSNEICVLHIWKRATYMKKRLFPFRHVCAHNIYTYTRPCKIRVRKMYTWAKWLKFSWARLLPKLGDYWYSQLLNIVNPVFHTLGSVQFHDYGFCLEGYWTWH